MEMLSGLLGVLLYFLPTLSARRHHNRDAIFALNLLLGWTVIGWIIAMIWACTKPAPAAAGTPSEARPSVTNDWRTRHETQRRRLISGSGREPAYVDPLTARFRHWPHFLIIFTLLGVSGAIYYFNRSESKLETTELPKGSSESSLRRVGDPVVTAIPRPQAIPAATPSIEEPTPQSEAKTQHRPAIGPKVVWKSGEEPWRGRQDDIDQLVHRVTSSGSLETISRSLPFEQCLQVIRQTASEVGAAPINVVETDIFRLVRFCGDDASIIVGCSRPDRKMSIIVSPHRPGCD